MVIGGLVACDTTGMKNRKKETIEIVRMRKIRFMVIICQFGMKIKKNRTQSALPQFLRLKIMLTEI